ncbi:PHM/PNGase F domain-containing protein [Polychytrium aggregatum]|uniref:PHM/PNGase F domain-containing protein n=1 Tax=Polychytrium aggregatum TaxID=110093 RepID=UPI0022FEDAB0|nr:PHM/PNGase F domain-containing protein [Polychytrium aggregatum]KAI9202259.1 PHM/PNGase F domain-containing protein [Polychytrium aggregatum]
MKPSLNILLFLYAAAIASLAVAAPNPSPYEWIPFPVANFTRHTTLITEGGTPLEMFWTVNVPGNSTTIGVAINKTVPWLGLGFSDTGSMVGADIALAMASSPGSPLTLQRMFAAAPGQPSPSQVQDLTLVYSNSSATQTSFVFTRPNSAGCNPQVRAIKTDNQTDQVVIYAFGSGSGFSQHASGDMGYQTILLSAASDAANTAIVNGGVIPADSTIFSMFMNQVPVPASVTSYCYQTFDLPTDAKYHIIKEEGFHNSSFVHHMVGYACDPTKSSTNKIATPFCTIPGSNDWAIATQGCSRFMFEWAPNKAPRVYPDGPNGYGKPVGKGFVQTILLEMHLNNPQTVAGQVVPFSGFNLTLTKTLRANDLGVITLGIQPVPQIMSIPPGQSGYALPSSCSPSCTNLLPKSGINIVGNWFHMHGAGQSISTRVIRNGVELQELGRKDYFDFNFQNFQDIAPRQILPGDTLITTCVYNSQNANSPIVGGFGTNNEMCYNFAEYYPLQPIGECSSSCGVFDNNATVLAYYDIPNFSTLPTFTPLPNTCAIAPQPSTSPTKSSAAHARTLQIGGLVLVLVLSLAALVL